MDLRGTNMDYHVYGYGRMGKAISYALHQLSNKKVIVHDIRRDQELEAWEEWGSDVTTGDVVISSMPYTENFKLAQTCINIGVHYFDLGGSVAVTQQIKNYCKRMRPTSVVFTDLGLAPGLINILGQHLIDKVTFKAKILSMLCGGYSANAKNLPFKYDRTWSTEGLINEFVEPYVYVYQGERFVDNSRHPIEYTHLEKTEMVITAGGLAHTEDFAVKRGLTCTYATLRPSGFYNLFKGFMDAGLTAKELEKIYPVNNDDIVRVAIHAYNNELCRDSSMLSYMFFPRHGFTAMQVSTGFSIACVAYLFNTEGLGHGWSTYEHVVDEVETFKNHFNTLYGEDIL